MRALSASKSNVKIITMTVVKAGTIHAVRQNPGASTPNTFSLASENNRSMKGADTASAARLNRILLQESKLIPGW